MDSGCSDPAQPSPAYHSSLPLPSNALVWPPVPTVAGGCYSLAFPSLPLSPALMQTGKHASLVQPAPLPHPGSCACQGAIVWPSPLGLPSPVPTHTLANKWSCLAWPDQHSGLLTSGSYHPPGEFPLFPHQAHPQTQTQISCVTMDARPLPNTVCSFYCPPHFLFLGVPISDASWTRLACSLPQHP